MKKPPIIVIVGPTASGKSALAISLAQTIGAEIISADSRQVYRRMDIGTGKVTPCEMRQVHHHLIDIENPKVEYNVSHFLRDATTAIADIEKRNKRVIICGGTTFWIEALLLGIQMPKVIPDKVFREKWGKKDTGELYGYLKRLDPQRAQSIDRKNKVRLLRAIEIAKALGSVPVIDHSILPDLSGYLVIGLNPPVEDLNKKIRERFMSWMKAGLVAEVTALNRSGVSYERLESFGLEYRSITKYLQKIITDAELYTDLPYEIIHYAKRQRSSLRRLEKRGVKIHWVQNSAEALTIVK